MDFLQKSFIGGLNQQVDATRLQDNEYPLLVNGRNRYDLVLPIKLPEQIVDIQLVGTKYQGCYAAANVLFVFISGKAYYKDFNFPASAFNVVAGFQLDPDVDIIFAELVPASTINFARVPVNAGRKNTEIFLTDLTGGSPQCIVVQDGKNQPWVIFSDFTARVTNRYDDWALDDREYVPIGKQMLYSDGILYVVASNGRSFYRSVTGRPLDFMVILKSDGNKENLETVGGAAQISHSVDYDVITAINRLPTDNGSFFVSTNRSAYAVTPDFSDPLFGEPQFINQFLFSAGATSPFSFIEMLGDNAFVDFNGLRSFNAILQLKNEGRNSPFSKKVGPILQGILQDYTAATTFDNYALFAVNTIYGRATIVYDMLSEVFVGLDIYPGVGQIKQFAEIKTVASRRLFFITVDNKLYEAFGSEDDAMAGLYAGEWTSNDPAIEQKAWQLKLIFVDAKAGGNVRVSLFVDRKCVDLHNKTLIQQINDFTAPIAIPCGAGNVDTVQIIAIDFFKNSLQGWKIGFFIEWDFEASLSHLKIQSIEEPNINSPSTQAKDFVTNRALLGNLLNQ